MSSTQQKPISALCGQSFRDREGHRWWVKGPRPGSDEQLVVEAEVTASYPRVDLYVMTEKQFHAHARKAALTPEKPGQAQRER